MEAVRQSHPGGLNVIIDVVSNREALSRIAELLGSGGRLATTLHAADIENLAACQIKVTNIDVLG